MDVFFNKASKNNYSSYHTKNLHICREHGQVSNGIIFIFQNNLQVKWEPKNLKWSLKASGTVPLLLPGYFSKEGTLYRDSNCIFQALKHADP